MGEHEATEVGELVCELREELAHQSAAGGKERARSAAVRLCELVGLPPMEANDAHGLIRLFDAGAKCERFVGADVYGS